MNRTNKLYDLKEKAREIEIRLTRLRGQIEEIQNHRGSADLKAVVDPGRCVACGICSDHCPEGAIVIEEIAYIDPARCRGCGICVDICRRGAISLGRGWAKEQEKKTGTI
ncbi:MAG: 4Fe-4S binding protein [Deltaproteobacteria bacterium]|nr:4Fe-4S binding protein [Deltaproteobacteria bacterium]